MQNHHQDPITQTDKQTHQHQTDDHHDRGLQQFLATWPCGLLHLSDDFGGEELHTVHAILKLTFQPTPRFPDTQ